MEETRKKLRLFLMCVVMAAVIVGIIYYFTDIYDTGNVSDGILVKWNCEEI